jgi:limonene-1,2-epoxide hydrolase
MNRSVVPPALELVRRYHAAWTGHDLDTAMDMVAETIVCQAPGGQVVGAAAYRGFLGGFMAQLTGFDLVAEFGDDTTAVLVYYPHTQTVQDAATAEWFSIDAGKIARTVLVFDRPSFVAAPS